MMSDGLSGAAWDTTGAATTSSSDQRVLPGEATDAPSPHRRRRAFVTIAAGFSLLAAACGLAGILSYKANRATESVLAGLAFREAEGQVFDALLNAETGQRGFLLTQEPEYLQPYQKAVLEFDLAARELRSLVAGTASRAAAVAEIMRLAAYKFAELNSTIALAKEGRVAEAIAILRAGSGKGLMEDIRFRLHILDAQVTDEIAIATDRQSRLDLLLTVAILATLIGAALLATLVLRNFRSHLRLLEGRDHRLRRLALTLERRVAERTRVLSDVNQRFDAALRASGVTVMTQDRDLVFTWVSKGELGMSPQEIIGKRQEEVTPDLATAHVAELKRGVIETGQPARDTVYFVHDGRERWHELSVNPLHDADGRTVGIVAASVDVTRLKSQQAHIALLLQEMTHRSKNLLAVVQAIMRQTAAGSDSIEDFAARFTARVQSLAQSHDLLVQGEWQGASLHDLVRSQMDHLNDRIGAQIEVTGEPLKVEPTASQHIAMAIHELATNAVKYGALSVPHGKVRIAWGVAAGADGEAACKMSWEEAGGPPVVPPTRRGFGRMVLEKLVANALHGHVTIDYCPSGARWALEFPTRFLIPG